jgi:hypothetical protein
MPRPIAVSSGSIATPMTATGNMNFLRPAITSLNTGAAKPCRNTNARRPRVGNKTLCLRKPSRARRDLLFVMPSMRVRIMNAE